MLQTLAGFDESDPRSLMIPVPDFSQEMEKPIQGLRVCDLSKLDSGFYRCSSFISLPKCYLES